MLTTPLVRHGYVAIDLVHEKDQGATAQRVRLPFYNNLLAPEDKGKLAPEDRLQVICLPCELCGQGPAWGVDRVDFAGTCALANCRPCCAPCNYLKGPHSEASLR